MDVALQSVRMRIIGGRYKGRRFQPPAKFKGRPTTDFAKEALFNILAHRIELGGCTVLDLFAGTGALGIEFASRGAVAITAVEKDPVACAFIRQTFAELGLSNGRVVRGDVFRFLTEHTATYDHVVADPPYDDDHVSVLPKKVHEAGVLKPGGYLILEHSADHNFANEPGFVESRRYGAVNFSFFTFTA